MKILWVSHLLPYPPKGGALQRSYNLLREVAKSNEVRLLAFNQRAILPTQQAVEESLKALRVICKSVEVVPIPADYSFLGKYQLALRSIFTEEPYTINWLSSQPMRDLIRQSIAAEPFDLAYFDTISLAPYRELIGKIPAVLNHHNIESEMLLRRAGKEHNILKQAYFSLEAAKLRRYEETMCGAFACHMTVSELDAQRLRAIAPEIRTAVIANGVDTEYFQPDHARIRPRSLVFAGGMTWYPNREAMRYFFRHIWPLLLREYPDITFDLIGRDPPVEIAALSKAHPNIRVRGFVDDVRPFISQSQVYVCPILDGGGTRLKIVDALAMGKAVVSTAIGCEGISVVPERDILIANDPSEFVRQIGRLFHDQELRERAQDSARRVAVEFYDWKSIGNKFNEACASLRTEVVEGACGQA